MAETLDTRALNMLLTRIQEEVQRESEAIVLGSLSSFDEYRHRAGIIKGMTKVAEMLDGVERDLYGRGPVKKA